MIDASRPDAPAPRRVTLSPAETVADAARKAIAFGAESLLRNQNAAESGEAEPLHQLRVATRRLRASIELFSNVIYAAQLKIFRRDLPWLGAQAGAVRECDVTSALIAARADRIDPDLKAAIAPMIAALDERRKVRAHEAVRAARVETLSGSARETVAAGDQESRRRPQARHRRRAIDQAGLARRIAAGRKNRRRRSASAFSQAPRSHQAAALRTRDDVAARRQASSQNLEAARRAAGTARPLSRHHGRNRMADVVCGNVRRAAADHARGRCFDPVARAAAKSKLRRQCMRAWRRFERSDAMHDTLEEIRRAGRLSLMPVSSPAPAKC